MKKKKNPAFFSKNMTGTFLLCTGIIHWSEYAVLSTDFFSYALTPEKDVTAIQLNIIRCFLQFIHETLTFYSRIESSHSQEMGGGDVFSFICLHLLAKPLNQHFLIIRSITIEYLESLSHRLSLRLDSSLL